VTTETIISKELLHNLFEYSDGNLIRKFTVNNRKAKKGDVAGCINKQGYLVTCINYKLHLNHRLIFMMHHGYLPKEVDHKDGNKLNNKIENLRNATHIQNSQNVKLQKNNTSGVKNVSFEKRTKKWTVRIGIDGKYKSFGAYKDLELAELIAIEARNKHHGEYANHG